MTKTFEQIESKLKKEYPHDSHAVYGTLNKIGLMKGSKVTAKGKALKKKLFHETVEKRKKAYFSGSMPKKDREAYRSSHLVKRK